MRASAARKRHRRDRHDAEKSACHEDLINDGRAVIQHVLGAAGAKAEMVQRPRSRRSSRAARWPVSTAPFM